MIFATTGNITKAIIMFALFGSVSGGVYPALSIIFAWTGKMLTAEVHIMKAKALFSRLDDSDSSINKKSKAAEIIYDFVFFVICGILFCIL